jgi:hypothetical protein
VGDLDYVVQVAAITFSLAPFCEVLRHHQSPSRARPYGMAIVTPPPFHISSLSIRVSSFLALFAARVQAKITLYVTN